MPPQTGHIIRRYRPKWWLRIFALGLFACSLAAFIDSWTRIALGGIQTQITAVLVTALLTLFGLTLSIHFFITSVTLERDAIELQTFFGKKRLALAEIRSRREDETTDSDGLKVRHIVLEPRDWNRTALKFQRIYNFDSVFELWLVGISSLDD